jgi:hypothetical protein
VFRSCLIRDLRLHRQNLVDAPHGRRAALEDVDDPSERDHRPHQLRHVGIERHEVTDVHAAEQYLASAQP